jgi:hypothetical protein
VLIGLDLKPAVAVGINALNLNNDLSMFLKPNPTEQSFQLVFETNQSEETTFQVMDQFGKILFVQNSVSNSGINTVLVNLPDLQSGLYFVKLNSGTKNSVQKLIIAK